MSGRLKKILWLLPIPIMLVAATTVPSGGWKMLNSARQVVIEFFDTGDATFTGDVTADAFIGDGSGLTGVSGGTGHTIKEEGSALTTRANLNFIGPTVTAADNAGTSATDVTINAVAGPSSSVDNTIPRFDSTTGKLVQGSGVTIDDSNNVGGIGALTANNLDLTTMLAVVEGGTGVATFTDAGVLIGNGSGNVQVTGAGTAGQVLTSNGTGVDPTFQSFPGGGDALTTQPLSQFASTTSLQLLTLLSNETGTGAAVFGTSPTLVTPNLGTPSALTLTNATGLPVAGGGTGATTFTDAGVLIGNSTGAVQSTGAGTSGQVLTSNGTGVDPTFQTFSAGSGDLVGPGSATDNAIARYDGTTGKLVQNSAVTIADTSGNIATSGTVDGRDLSTDGTKLDGIESGATADQTDSEIETAYNNQVAVVSQATAEAGSSTTVVRWTPQRVSQAIAALAGSGGDPTYGSETAASDDAVFVDEFDNVGIGTTSPIEDIDVYRTDNAPRVSLRYLNAGGSGNDIDYAQSGTDDATVGVVAAWFGTNTNLSANDTSYKEVINSVPGGNDKLTHYLFAQDYPIDIPTGATVDGIEFVVNGQYNEDDTPHAADDTYIRIIKGGTVQTVVNRASGTTWPQSSETTRTYGGPTDLWGTTWTESDVEASTFGLAMAFTIDDNDLMYIDYVTVKVYYTDGIAGDYVWTSGVDLSDGAYTIRANATDQLRIAYSSGDAVFSGTVTADSFIGGGFGDASGPGSATDNAIARFDGTTGKLIQNSAVTIADTSGNITTSGTVDGRDLSTDGTKLDGIESGATADQTNSEIETAYNTQVSVVSQATAEAGTSTTVVRWTPERVKQAIAALATGDIVGPVTSVTDDAVVTWDGTTGNLVQNSAITIVGSNIAATTFNGTTIPTSAGTVATLAGSQTLTDTRVGPRILADNTTPINVDYDSFSIVSTTLGANVTIDAPTGTPQNGERLLYRIKQGAGAYTATWNTVFKSYSATGWDGAIPAVNTTNGAYDYFEFVYLSTGPEWHLVNHPSVPSGGGGDAYVANPLSQFASTTSSQLLGVMSDETGSGLAVFNTSPTFITPILGTPTSGNLANCTFPTLNQNTSGSAATLTTARAIYGNNFDGSAALTQIIASTYGGTGNGFTKFSGPASTEKTFTLPNSSDTLAAIGTAQTWTGIQSFNSGKVSLNGATSGATVVNAAAIAGSTTLTLPAATDTLVGKATTDTLTNKTFDTAGTGNSFSINGVAATANTGTGSVVRATSPTLVTPALGTPSALVLTNATGLPAAAVGNGLTDAQVSDTLTSSLFVGSGSSTTAIDLATAEVAGDLPFANITQIGQYEVLGRVASSTGDFKALSRVEQDTIIEVESELTSSSNATAWNSDGVKFFHDTLTQNTTVSASSGTLRTNQYVQFRFTAATGADYTLAWNSLFAAGSGSPFAGTIPAMNTTDGRDSVYLFQYRGSKLWLAAYREDN